MYVYIFIPLSLSHIHEDPVFAVAGLGLLAPPLLLGGGWCGGASRNFDHGVRSTGGGQPGCCSRWPEPLGVLVSLDGLAGQ